MPSKSSRSRGESAAGTFIKLILLVIGAGVLLALAADISSFMEKHRKNPVPPPETEIQNIILQTRPKVFQDVKGLFTMNAPEGWDIIAWPESTPYNVTFQSRNGPSISVTATPVEYSSLVTLEKRIRAIQADYGLNMNIVQTNWNGREIVQRTTVLHASKVLTLDFVQNYVGHNIQISIPHSLYDRYIPVLLDVAKSYKPLK